MYIQAYRAHAKMKRQKRRPDSIELNFVESHPKRKSVKIKRVSYSLARPTQEAPSATSATCASTLCSSASSDLCETPSNFGEPFNLQGDTSFCFNTKPRESHTERKQKAAEAWAEVRGKLHPLMISVSGFPRDKMCVFCNCSSARVWCRDCGAGGYLCEACTSRLHSGINLFHSPLLWKVMKLTLSSQ